MTLDLVSFDSSNIAGENLLKEDYDFHAIIIKILWFFEKPILQVKLARRLLFRTVIKCYNQLKSIYDDQHICSKCYQSSQLSFEVTIASIVDADWMTIYVLSNQQFLKLTFIRHLVFVFFINYKKIIKSNL